MRLLLSRTRGLRLRQTSLRSESHWFYTGAMTGPIPARAAERAATRYVEELCVSRLGPCYISTYSTGSHGYAQVGWLAEKYEATTAHRAAWTHHNGPIPVGLTVDHVCKVRSCVRIDHLRLLPNGANASDNGQIRSNPDSDSPCPTCGELRSIDGGGRLYCRTCQNRRRRARRALGKTN